MQNIMTVVWTRLVLAVTLLTVLAANSPVNAIDTSKPLDTRKGLYISKKGTRVYKDPLPRKSKVYSFRRKDGTWVRHYAIHSSQARRSTKAKKRSSKRRYSKKPSTYRR